MSDHQEAFSLAVKLLRRHACKRGMRADLRRGLRAAALLVEREIVDRRVVLTAAERRMDGLADAVSESLAQ